MSIKGGDDEVELVMKKRYLWGSGVAILMLSLIFVRIFNHGSSKLLGESTTVPSSAPSPTATPIPTPAAAATPAPTAAPLPTCVSAAQAASEEGQTGCVKFIGHAYTSSSGSVYLDQNTSAPYGFSVYIPAGSSWGPGVLSQFSGNTIDVTGNIANYQGEPEIEIDNPTEIQLAQ